MDPEVTIITPTKNIVEEGYADDFNILVGLIDRQTYVDIDHLVIDGASTDETLELLKDYKNNGYLNFFSAPDNGKYDAINKGILRAKGKYIGILSCDDFYHDITGIADIVQVMEAENADFCYFPSYCMMPDNDAFLFTPSIYNVFQVAPFPHQAVIYKKQALEKLGYFDSKFKIMADYDLHMRLVLNKFKGIAFDAPIVTYHMGDKAQKFNAQVEAECKHIYYKNLKSFYNLDDFVLEKMLKLSEIPEPMLKRLAGFFPGDEQLFNERCETMHNMRVEAEKIRRQEERNNR